MSTLLAPLTILMATLPVTAMAATTATAGSSNSNSNSNNNMNKPPPPRRQMPYIRPTDLYDLMGDKYDPKQAENWMSINEDVEYLPVLHSIMDDTNNENNNKRTSKRNTNNANVVRSLEETTTEEGTTTGAYANYDPFSVQPFVEGMSEYDEYQQAWRLLGFMIDCNLSDDDYEASGHSSGDEVTDEGCARYVLWAAYVDLEYEGGGIGEYQYWDRSTQAWNDTSCEYADKRSGGSGGSNDNDNNDNGSRCAKMDCHLEDTHFSVLGFFKHRSYDDWMEQLFKHEGMCVWTEEEYAFMKNARKAWPKGCTSTGTTISTDDDDDGGGDDDEFGSSSSTMLYYDIRPLPSGRIAVGLYTDEQCITEYPAETETIEDIVGNVFLDAGSQHSNDNGDDGETYDFSSDSLSDSMNRWDSAFDVWHTCHPCVAYDLENTEGNMYTDDDDGGYYYYYNGYYYYGNAAEGYEGGDDGNNRERERNLRNNRSRRKLGGEYSAQGDVFECYDDAGYTNVNQCMKFSAKTVMKTATFRDLSLGRHQGSLAEYPLSGYVDAREQYAQKTKEYVTTYLFLISMSGLLIFSLWNLYKVAKESRRSTVAALNGDSLLT